jgi:hypothetical protein
MILMVCRKILYIYVTRLLLVIINHVKQSETGENLVPLLDEKIVDWVLRSIHWEDLAKKFVLTFFYCAA